MMTPWTYDLLIEGNFNPVKIDLGNDEGWIKKYREELDAAERISLVSKDSKEQGSVITISLDGDKRWVFFSRVCGRISGGTGKQIRLYCIGWQRTVAGENVKSLTWVYPNGVIENNVDPAFTHHFLN